MIEAPPEKPKLNPLLKLALDIGPLVLFFVANARFGIFAGTGAFMVAVVAALLVSSAMIRLFRGPGRINVRGGGGPPRLSCDDPPLADHAGGFGDRRPGVRRTDALAA